MQTASEQQDTTPVNLEPPGMRRALAVLSCLAGVVWGGMIGWSVNRPETTTRVRIRTGAFVVLVGAGLLAGSAARDEDEGW